MHVHKFSVLLTFLCFKKIISSKKISQDFSIVATTQNPTNCNHDLIKQLDTLKHEINLTRTELLSKFQELERMFQQSRQQSEQINSTQSKKPTPVDIPIGKDYVPENCQEVKERNGIPSGIYIIKPRLAFTPIFAYCDMETRGGGWTYILNRFDGSHKFYRKWNEYKAGFGNIAGEFWIGLDNLYHLTGSQVNELLIELVDWDMKKVYAHYKYFAIGNETEGYILKILGAYSGDAGDSFTYNAGQKFSTLDRDQDDWSEHCAKEFGGAWWYTACFSAHLTGKYQNKGSLSAEEKNRGIQWGTWRGNQYSCKQARMMIRPRNSNN